MFDDKACANERSDFLSGDNYQELQNFGLNIKEKQKEDTTKRVKTKYLIFKEFVRTINENMIEKREVNTKKWCNAIVGTSNFINTTGQRANKKLNEIVDRLHHCKKQVQAKSSNVQLNKTKKIPRYKLVEVRKQRGNKTIVIRRIIPIKYDEKRIEKHQKVVQQTLFDLQSEFDGNCAYEVRTIPDRHLKSSIWDMPIESGEKTEKWKTIFDFWNTW